MDSDVVTIPMFAGYDRNTLAAAAIAELLGGESVVDMIARRAQGHSLRQIAERYNTSHVNVAKRLEVAEHRIDRVKALAERLSGCNKTFAKSEAD